MDFLGKLQREVRGIAKTFSISEAKAFSVWFAKTALDLDDDDAFDALSVEGPNEKGMDVFWIDQQNHRVFIAQCKYSASGKHRAKEKDLAGLLSCIDWLASPKTLEAEGRSELVAAAREYQDAIAQDYAVQLWFAYAGPRSENVEKRVRVYNANPENERMSRSAIHCDIDLITHLYDEARGESRRIGSAKVSIDTLAFEVTGDFGKGLVTSIRGPELVSLYDQFGDKLFARNVRGWLGSRKGSVDAAIMDTVENSRERGNFWAYNNGITIVCEDYKYDPENNSLHLQDFSIVNGCQTTVALAKSKPSSEKEKVAVLARVICPPESIIDSVIRYTNSQNLIRKWDLASQDPTQRRLKKEFESLQHPVYYMIRRGEWPSLSAAEKRRFRSANGGGGTVKHDLLAQYIASFRGDAVVAYKNKAFLFDRFYDKTFPADSRVEELLFVWRVGEITQDLVRKDIREESDRVQKGEKEREKYILMLKRGGRFYAVAVFGLVAKLRNGGDYLRSIQEDRIVSNNAHDRITKYARMSIQWYKQAVNDLVTLRRTDLSVLIREKAFFSYVSERIANTYHTMEINKDWLDGALPRLF